MRIEGKRSLQKYAVQQKLMGCIFEFIIISEDPFFAEQQLQLGIQEVERLESLLSEFLPYSDTSEINSSAFQQPVKVNQETFGLIQRSNHISALTNGYFDISTGALKQLYQFHNTFFKMPAPEQVAKKLQSVGYHNIILSKKEMTVFLKKENMKISFAAIGKGFASDCIKKLWIKNGVKKGCISASGDMNVIVQDDNASPWEVAIAHPDDMSKPILKIPLRNFAIATSGDYLQHFIYKGVKYSHNINPLTGYPISGIKSVSVLSPSSELSDALATAVFAMGVLKGIDFINQLPQTHCIIVDEKNDLRFSKKIKHILNL